MRRPCDSPVQPTFLDCGQLFGPWEIWVSMSRLHDQLQSDLWFPRTCWLWRLPGGFGAPSFNDEVQSRAYHYLIQWPYTYDQCDVGTAPNQTLQGLPEAALTGGDPAQGGSLSFLPGQKLSRCTCSGESHPGPVHKDGSLVGRSAPEIDVFEATVTLNHLGRQMNILMVALD